MKKNKLLICALFMSMILTVMPGMKSYAAEETGENAAASELQDENSQRLDSVTAMDEDGSIYEVGESDGTVDEGTAGDSSEEDSGIALFSARSARAVSTKVVNFNTKGNATTDFTYSGGGGYTNGNYGADAAYLGTDGSGNIKFMLAGVTGTVAASEVELVDYSAVADNVSYYTVSGGKLIHYISYNLNSSPTSSINNGPAPSYLSEGTKYYSYDGHYFYTDYETMTADYQRGANGSSAVNPGNPFSNYFQFRDMNSSTNYTGSELDNILKSKISSSSSKLLGTGKLFVKYQNEYSVNALLSLGIAVNESAWGTSSICMNKNNLFGLNAVDTSPGQSANYFASVEDCIREFMYEWMADGYLSSSDWRNHGEYLGNKAAGINVSYASDPYWGEKAAAIAWELDEAGRSCDYLGISSGNTDDSSNDNAEVPETDNTPPADTGSSDAQEPSDTDDTSDNTSDTQEPSDTDDASDDTANTQEPSDTGDKNDASGTDETPETEQPSDTNASGSDNGSDTQKPSEDVNDASDNSSDTQKPSDTDNGTDTQKPSDTDNGTDIEKPSDTEQPSAGSETSDAAEVTDEEKPSVTTDTADDSKSETTDTDNSSQNQSSNQSSAGNGSSNAVKEEQSSGNGKEQTVQNTGTTQNTVNTQKAGNNDSKVKINTDYGIKVSGVDGEMSVRAIEPNTNEYDSYVSADPVKGKEILGVYDITVSGTVDGKAQLTFQVGSEYDGRNVIILHFNEDGSYDKYTGTIENGQVTVSVDGFSPYLIALDDGSPNSMAPQTGDTASPVLWMSLMGISVSLGVIVLLKRRSFR